MKKIAGLCVLIMFLIPAYSTVSAETGINLLQEDRIELSQCTISLNEAMDNFAVNNSHVNYVGFSIMVDPDEDGYCEITLNGTIETDIGTATFKDFKLKVKGDDCTELALKLLRSFRED